jgi:DNA-binding Lrp family transcriptional regulator
MNALLNFISDNPKGVSAGEIERQLKLSRTTLNRRLKEELQAGTIVVAGKGPSTRYHSADPLSALRAYISKPHTEREMAPYQEARLSPLPLLSAETERRFAGMPEHRLDKRELGDIRLLERCFADAYAKSIARLKPRR